RAQQRAAAAGGEPDRPAAPGAQPGVDHPRAAPVLGAGHLRHGRVRAGVRSRRGGARRRAAAGENVGVGARPFLTMPTGVTSSTVLTGPAVPDPQPGTGLTAPGPGVRRRRGPARPGRRRTVRSTDTAASRPGLGWWPPDGTD